MQEASDVVVNPHDENHIRKTCSCEFFCGLLSQQVHPRMNVLLCVDYLSATFQVRPRMNILFFFWCGLLSQQVRSKVNSLQGEWFPWFGSQFSSCWTIAKLLKCEQTVSGWFENVSLFINDEKQSELHRRSVECVFFYSVDTNIHGCSNEITIRSVQSVCMETWTDSKLYLRLVSDTIEGVHATK